MVLLATTDGLLLSAAAPCPVDATAGGAAPGPAARGGAAAPAGAAAVAPVGTALFAVVASGLGVALVSTRITERTVSLAVRLPVASSSVIVLARIDVAPCHSWASPVYSACPVCWL